MKLLLILSAILALSLAEEEKKDIQEIEDSEAQAANVELLKEGADLKPAASSYPYIPPSQREPVWQNPQNTWQQQQPGNNNWGQPPSNVQSDYYWSTGNPHYHPPTTTTPVPIIKQEHYIGDNGNYKYEYQIADGTHVGEEGYFTNPKQDEESLVKRGWYSYTGPDGKVYTVTYWADKTGFHAFGDHLPTPPPVPAAIQAALDQQKEAEKNKPQHDYPVTTPAPKPVYPTHPTYVPSPKPDYVPSQPTYYPTPAPAQPKPQVPTYNPPQYYPSQQYYPPQQTQYYPSQQTQYYPSQQTQYPQQQNNYVPNYSV